MDSDSIRYIIFLGLLIAASAFFSASETAYTSLNRMRLKELAEDGDKKAKLALSLADNYDTLLSTILVGNNIVNILASSLATVLFVTYFPVTGVTISTIVMTILVLIFGEISPKSIAKERPEAFAVNAAPFLRIGMVVLTPVNFFFKSWKKLLNKLFTFEASDSISEKELLFLVDEAQNSGGIENHEHQLIRSAITFNELEVQDILTPRVDVIGTDVNSSLEEIETLFLTEGYSRIVLYDDSIDKVVGVLHQKDFYAFVKNNAGTEINQSIQSIVKDVIWTPANMKISKLLKQLQLEKAHLAIVSDEYGGTIGIVTLEDILEELVGEIWDEHDEVTEEVVKIDESTYRIAASANLDKVLSLFGIEEEFISNTVSGFVMEQMGKLPDEGDTFVYHNLKITVTKVRFRRILETFVELIPETDEEELLSMPELSDPTL
ncbi:hemolysin family protein [Desemzia sp. C1]|uniref:Hemolysin, contains CBS domains n=1 Tax=Desemzia incerta TaxID=82801 RepID=A0A1I5Y9M1_9LACT|nr:MULTISPECIES: hemolysin family protein [Desemzia]MCI3028479.1 hemolysin family protein [Desemzia sp. C1]SFQ40894.1 Hemolysin, contains CBS domains [Desemzia incerta]